jgi:hypothetical protein
VNILHVNTETEKKLLSTPDATSPRFGDAEDSGDAGLPHFGGKVSHRDIALSKMSRVEEDPSGENVEDSERSKELVAASCRVRTARRNEEAVQAASYHPEDDSIISVAHSKPLVAATFAEEDRSESSGNPSSDGEEQTRNNYKAEVRVVRLFDSVPAATVAAELSGSDK